MLLAVLAGSSQWLAVGLGVGVVLGSAVGFLGDMGIGTYILGLTYMSTQLKMMFGFSGSGLHPNEVLKEQELQKVLRKCMLRMERIVSSCTRLHPSRLGKNPPPTAAAIAKRLGKGNCGVRDQIVSGTQLTHWLSSYSDQPRGSYRH